ncbi:Pkinase-domain-containing protein, partial [Cutaneotrichosporon oleaginosum]
MDQIHQLLRMRSQLSKDQQELKSMHAQALRSEIAPPPDAPSGPRATREREEVRFGAPPAGPAPPLGIPPFPLPPSAPRQPPKPRPKPVVAPKQPRRRAVAGERYERLAQVGEGTYGKVYKARNTGSGALVALKRIRMEQEREGFPVTSMREIKLLQALDHPNIVRLMEMMVSHNSVYMVLEYMNHDLTGILSHPEVKLSPANIKSLNYQMLSGLGYLHRRGILHRDMKGSNILLNGEGELKLADFGLARWYHKHKRDDYTNRVITLWYRSPELLMGETAYGPEVDTWSAGCIMLEIFTGKPTFQGQDEISQLDAIWAILGTPLEADWPAVTDLPWYELVRPREAITSRFAEKFSLSAGAMEVVKGLLELNPAKRLLADDALDKAYFVSEAPQMEQPTQ